MEEGKTEEARQAYESAYNAFKDTSKQLYAVDVGKKVLEAYLESRWYKSAMKIMV